MADKFKTNLAGRRREIWLFTNVNNVALCKGIREMLACANWNPESWALESGTQPREPKIALKIGIRNQSFTDKESRIQDYLGFPYMGRIPSSNQAYLKQIIGRRQSSTQTRRGSGFSRY